MKTADDYFDAANGAELDSRYEEANAYYEKALQLQPDFPEAYSNRAKNWDQLGQYGKAIADFEKVLAYWPDDVDAHEGLGSIYLLAEDRSFRDSRLALQHARRACELCQFSQYMPVSTLAAAYAANGQYAEAICMQERAIEMASGELESELWLPKLREELLEYRKKNDERRRRGWFAWLFRRSSERT
jgi:tetratricopeptide (TPR) repeat protein